MGRSSMCATPVSVRTQTPAGAVGRQVEHAVVGQVTFPGEVLAPILRGALGSNRMSPSSLPVQTAPSVAVTGPAGARRRASGTAGSSSV